MLENQKIIFIFNGAYLLYCTLFYLSHQRIKCHNFNTFDSSQYMVLEFSGKLKLKIWLKWIRTGLLF
jgi:hypothetical protein